MKESFSFRRRMQSFRPAFKGIGLLFRNEHNAWIHMVVSLAVIGFGIVFSLTAVEWIALILSIGFVFMAEMINSSIEKLADAVEEKTNEKIRIAKDLAAGAVLVAAICAAAIGLIVFVPHAIGLLT